MKLAALALLASITGFFLAWNISSHKSADALQRERAAWAAEKVRLEAALADASQPTVAPTVVEKTKVVRVPENLDPKHLITKLRKIRISSGAGQTRNARVAIQHFESLISLRDSALPAIREFLLRNEEIDYDSSLSPRGSRDGRISTEFALPPSLRFGLFDVVRQIGGAEAERLLAEIATITGRGAELAYLARVLQDISPDKYRDLCLNAARELLAARTAAGAAGLDKYDREYLFGVLALFGDGSFVNEAQGQLVRADGLVDRGALKYLQQTLGAQAMPSIANAYNDPSIEPSKKEPLARYALTFTGTDPQATEFLHAAFKDPKLPLPERAELIEDLNQDGIQSEDNPTARDAEVIRARLVLIERWFPEADQPALVAAFNEARKDLVNMLKRYNSSVGLPAQ